LKFRRKRERAKSTSSATLRVGDFVRVAGAPAGYKIEQHPDATRIDHLTILVRAAQFGMMEIALNTYSLRNLSAGFDPRVRLALARSTWNTLPPAGVTRSAPLDYRILEASGEILYHEHERQPLETLLIGKLERAVLAEGWGEFYERAHPGIHQVHSRRASCAVLIDHLERDGAIRFYFPDNTAELLLLKYCGQA
jgi:hypothetical protein